LECSLLTLLIGNFIFDEFSMGRFVALVEGDEMEKVRILRRNVDCLVLPWLVAAQKGLACKLWP